MGLRQLGIPQDFDFLECSLQEFGAVLLMLCVPFKERPDEGGLVHQPVDPEARPGPLQVGDNVVEVVREGALLQEVEARGQESLVEGELLSPCQAELPGP